MPPFVRSAVFRWVVIAPVMFAAFVVSFGFVTFHWMRAATIPKRDKIVAELDATDPGWQLHDLMDERNARLPPPEQNAAELAFLARQKTPKAFRDWESKSESAKWRADLENPHLPQKADITETRKQLRKAHEALEMARELRHVPSGGLAIYYKEPNPLNTLLPKHQELRAVCSLLSYDAAVRAYDRDGTGAIDSCLAILATARGFGDDPWLIGQLIRIAGVAITVGAAERVLCWCDGIDDAKLVELDRAFEAEANEPRLLYGLRGERALFYRITENIDSGAMSVSELSDGKPGPFERLQTAPFRSRLPDEQAVGLDMFTRLMEAAKLPPGRARTTALDAVETEHIRLTRSGPVPRYILLRLLMPAISKVSEADNRIVAQLNAARVAIACERHRQKTGAYPEKLDELPKELLAEVPVDPFSGQPILYKKLPDGAVAYSVSHDGKDDGAVKLTLKNEKGNDMGFRLWTSDHRRQPPEPKKPDPYAGLSSPGFGIEPSPTSDKPTTPPPLSPWVKKD